MEWIKYTIHTTEEAEDLVTATLAELGIYSVEIEDKAPIPEEQNTGLFGEVVPEMPEDDHLADISFYMEADADAESVIANVAANLNALRDLADIGDCTITTSMTAEEDWINNWKQYFHQFYVEDILIVPTWEDQEAEPAEEDKEPAMVLRIDPGTAFGTGKHETTQLAIKGIRRYLKDGDTMLDIGTGSGILGIIALKTGASRVYGTDIDPQVIPAIADNLEKNDVDPANFPYVIGNVVDEAEAQAAVENDPAYNDGQGYDIVVANIIAEILFDITPVAVRYLKKGGVYITSGILEGHQHIVYEAMEKAGLTILEDNQMGEWHGIVARKD
ncbi:MAG: 50S ribosomal protein L11 methyltransferase [Lachnospiraceae bacterium]|nr:50S ribosomal protein L11 methyltransferase [Candidatus Equihabitans merdae]